MKTGTVTLSKTESKKKLKAKEIDYEFVQQVIESLEDAKHGRIRRVA